MFRSRRDHEKQPELEAVNAQKRLEIASDGRLFQTYVAIPDSKDGQTTGTTSANNNVNAHGSTENGAINDGNVYVTREADTAGAFMEDNS